MGWMNQIGGILQQYVGAGGGPPQPPAAVEQHFDQVAQSAPQGTLTDALSQVFRSSPPTCESTPGPADASSRFSRPARCWLFD